MKYLSFARGLAQTGLVALACTGGCDSRPSSTDSHPTVTVDVHLLPTCPLGAQALLAAQAAAIRLGDDVKVAVHHVGAVKDDAVATVFGARDLNTGKLQACAARDDSEGHAAAFLQCMARGIEAMPAGWEACARQAELDVAQLRDCAEGDQGAQLLLKSVQRSVKAGVTTSPALRIDGQRYEGPVAPGFLVEALCQREEAPAGCEGRTPPPTVEVKLLHDPRCKRASCDVQALRTRLRATILGAAVTVVTWESPEGRQLERRIPTGTLPVAFLGASKATLEQALGPRLLSEVRGVPDVDDLFVLPLGGDWDPRAELCGDETDNDGDGRVDCEDLDCMHTLDCRPRVPGSLQVFGLASDGFSLRALEAAVSTTERLQLPAPTFRHVGQLEGTQLVSTRGESEVRSALWQVCVQEQAGASGLLSFARCAAEGTKPPQACVAPGLDARRIDACLEGTGPAKLAASYRESQQLRLKAVPAVLIDNRRLQGEYSPEAIARGVCEAPPSGVRCPSAEEPSDATR